MHQFVFMYTTNHVELSLGECLLTWLASASHAVGGCRHTAPSINNDAHTSEAYEEQKRDAEVSIVKSGILKKIMTNIEVTFMKPVDAFHAQIKLQDDYDALQVEMKQTLEDINVDKALLDKLTKELQDLIRRRQPEIANHLAELDADVTVALAVQSDLVALRAFAVDLMSRLVMKQDGDVSESRRPVHEVDYQHGARAILDVPGPSSAPTILVPATPMPQTSRRSMPDQSVYDQPTSPGPASEVDADDVDEE